MPSVCGIATAETQLNDVDILLFAKDEIIMSCIDRVTPREKRHYASLANLGRESFVRRIGELKRPTSRLIDVAVPTSRTSVCPTAAGAAPFSPGRPWPSYAAQRRKVLLSDYSPGGADMRTAHEASIGIGTLAPSCSALAADTNRKDTGHLQKSADGLKADVKMGEMGRQRAAAEHVSLPDEPSSKQRKEVDKLAKLSGAGVDKEYLGYELNDDKDDVEENGKTVKSAADPDVMRFADAECQTVPGSRKEIDDIPCQPGK